MEYLLTQEEYHNLKNQIKDARESKSDIIQDLCTQIADTKPIKGWWNQNGVPSPWGCMITKTTEDDTGDWQEWYCDACPVQGVCPCPDKEWSK